MKIITGEQISEKIKQNLREQVQNLSLNPKLVIIYIGKNAASELYIEKKVRWAEEVGIDTEIIRYTDTSIEEVVKKLEELNKDKTVSGYIIQLPIPSNLNRQEILEHIDPKKDVDGLSPLSLGLLWQENTKGFTSATVLGILECIKFVAKYSDGEYTSDEIELEDDVLLEKFLSGKEVLIINHSIIVGKPLAAKLLQYKATITIAHKDTPVDSLNKMIRNSDIIVSATGIEGFIKSSQVTDGQILIDVGINKTAQGVGGDIDHKGLEDIDVWVSPVPGGVGPLTVAMLLKNTVKAAHRNN